MKNGWGLLISGLLVIALGLPLQSWAFGVLIGLGGLLAIRGLWALLEMNTTIDHHHSDSEDSEYFFS